MRGDPFDRVRGVPQLPRRAGDSIGPGATALTRIAWGAHSTASVWVIDITPAFAAAEWIVPGLPVQT